MCLSIGIGTTIEPRITSRTIFFLEPLTNAGRKSREIQRLLKVLKRAKNEWELKCRKGLKS